MKKKIVTATLFFACLPYTSFARQTDSESIRTRDKSIYLELLGPSNLIGISFDARFKPHSPFGYRVGISYFPGNIASLFSASNAHLFFFPVEVNYLLGKKKHKLEIGTGFEIGLVNEKTYYYYPSTNQSIQTSNNYCGYLFYSNIGYRYQTNHGFQFRIGINPTYSPNGKHAAKRDPSVAPYVSFGYAF